MHLLITNSHPDRSETSMFTGLKKAGVDIEVLCDPNAVRAGELADAGIPVTKIPFRHRIDTAVVRCIRKRIRNKKPDIIHSFTKRSLSNVMFATYGTDIRLVTYRGIIGNLSRWNPETRLTFLSKRLSRIICVCEAVRKYMLSIGVPPERAVTILKGHDVSWYKKTNSEFMQELGIPSGSFIIGCAAKMRARKGIDVLIKAFSRIRNPGAHLVLAGEITDLSLLSTISRQDCCARIHTTGWIENAPSIMGACSVFVMPSLRREGLPRAVIEAMAQGVPAIVTNVGGMPEIVDHNVNGMVVAPDSIDDLANALEKLASNTSLRIQLGSNARHTITDKFNINKTTEETLAVYRNILSE